VAISSERPSRAIWLIAHHEFGTHTRNIPELGPLARFVRSSLFPVRDGMGSDVIWHLF
jgi:hypothetical protein